MTHPRSKNDLPPESKLLTIIKYIIKYILKYILKQTTTTTTATARAHTREETKKNEGDYGRERRVGKLPRKSYGNSKINA
jgi:hypothetical protein